MALAIRCIDKISVTCINSGNSCLDGGFTNCNVSQTKALLNNKRPYCKILASDICKTYGIIISITLLPGYYFKGKYNLALGMEYAVSSQPSSFKKYLSVLKLIPENIKGLNANLETVNGLDISLNGKY